MIYRTLSHQKIGPVAVVNIGGPDYRGLTPQLATEIDAVCDDIAWDEQTRVVALLFDGEISPSSGGDPEAEDSSIVESFARLKQPVIAGMRGDTVGLGLELAMACDVRIASEGSRFGFPGVRDGATPHAGGTQRLPRLIGRAKALELLLTGDLIDGDEALRIGLISRSVHASSLEGVVVDMAKEMAEKSPLATDFVKEALRNGLDLTLDQGLRMELDLYLLLFTTKDRVEGVNAFKEKRKPEFKGE